MDQQIKVGKALKYPPMDSMTIFETDEQLTIKSLVEKIENLIPSKYRNPSTQIPLTTDPLQPALLTILEAIKVIVAELGKQQPTEQSETTSVKENDETVTRMKEMLEMNQFKARKIQVKLLGTIKKLNQEIKEKDLMMEELKKIIEEKEIEMESMYNMNEKKYRQIRQLQQDAFDLQQEINKISQQLQNQQKYTTILQLKLQQLNKKPPHPEKLLPIEPPTQVQLPTEQTKLN